MKAEIRETIKKLTAAQYDQDANPDSNKAYRKAVEPLIRELCFRTFIDDCKPASIKSGYDVEIRITQREATLLTNAVECYMQELEEPDTVDHSEAIEETEALFNKVQRAYLGVEE